MICREDDSQELDWPALKTDRIPLDEEGARIELLCEKPLPFHSLCSAFQTLLIFIVLQTLPLQSSQPLLILPSHLQHFLLLLLPTQPLLLIPHSPLHPSRSYFPSTISLISDILPLPYCPQLKFTSLQSQVPKQLTNSQNVPKVSQFSHHSQKLSPNLHTS